MTVNVNKPPERLMAQIVREVRAVNYFQSYRRISCSEEESPPRLIGRDVWQISYENGRTMSG